MLTGDKFVQLFADSDERLDRVLVVLRQEEERRLGRVPIDDGLCRAILADRLPVPGPRLTANHGKKMNMAGRDVMRVAAMFCRLK
jgi:hypothetical protein